MNRNLLIKSISLLFVASLLFQATARAQPAHLEEGFADPPQEAGVRCWWWWLNSNVTKEAITRDLEAMKAKGFSGAMIFDAGGANQRGNEQVPAGPLYGSPAWRELYKHALKEAKRLNLVLGLSIQSGWNLGGPNVTPEFAAKQITFSEISLQGPIHYNHQLPRPDSRFNYYKDICVLAFPVKPTQKNNGKFTIHASSSQNAFPANRAADGEQNTFWVSAGIQPGEGPLAKNPEWLTVSFEFPQTVASVQILGRNQYGPKAGEILYADPKGSYKTIKQFTLKDGEFGDFSFSPKQTKSIRLAFHQAYDPRSPQRPRNVQVAELRVCGKNGDPIAPAKMRTPIRDLRLKSAFRELGGSAPDCRFLLNDCPPTPGEEDTHLHDILDLTDRMNSAGILDWHVPEGNWTVLRFGFTPTNAHVSTYSGEWKGHVVDYLRQSAFDRYWNEIVVPLLAEAGPLKGTVLRQLETDSWECGGMNWSDHFRDDFLKYRGYDPLPYLPIIAGKIVENREVSNRFLADFRKTLGDCVSDNHYKRFAELAHKNNLQIQPESGGPHAGPLDAIKNLGHNDIVVGEFWVPSPHRPRPVDRFFLKQSSSVAHIYGKKYVAAESFTSIGPHWNDVLWQAQKPSADHEFCSGLNMVFFHTFTCSPKEMGLPGQEYFAGTHVNPQVTWWDHADAFIDYLNRCQFLLQKGDFVADVLYYYGDHVPNVARLKEDDPARVLPGYDYDITNEDILLQLQVKDGQIVVSGGVQYRLLVLPDHQVLSLAVLEKVEELVRQGATVLGPKPLRLVSLVGGDKAQRKFKTISNRLWGKNPQPSGQKTVGEGKLYWGETGREVLQKVGIYSDFHIKGNLDPSFLDYIHYTLGDAPMYFVCNQTGQSLDVDCLFRVTGRKPELWDPLTGNIRALNTFTQNDSHTTIPLHFGPYGSWFILFRDPIPAQQQGAANRNFPILSKKQDIAGAWNVSFDPAWGGPESIRFDTLKSWTEHDPPGIRYYSGKAKYTKTFALNFPVNPNKRYWLDLGEIGDIGIASARMNGADLGIVWTKPFRVDITSCVKEENNRLEITVINSWRNRLVGDRNLPKKERYTQTNIRIRPEWEILESGLLGPVTILSHTRME
ncbi:glycoside hydrolase [bacterium]|nr:glycoside hydrolase [bacterium]